MLMGFPPDWCEVEWPPASGRVTPASPGRAKRSTRTNRRASPPASPTAPGS